MINRLRHMFEVEHTANSALLAALGEDDTDALAIMQHIVYAQSVYLAKWRGEGAPDVPSDPWSVEVCKRQETASARAWQGHLSGIDASDLDWELEQSSVNVAYRLDATDMAIHVITHGFYHRAQIDVLLRQAGRESPRAGYAFLARERVG